MSLINFFDEAGNEDHLYLVPATNLVFAPEPSILSHSYSLLIKFSSLYSPLIKFSGFTILAID